MEVKHIESEYKESIKDVLSYCFDMPAESTESLVNKNFNPEDWLGCFIEDKLTGAFFPFPITRVLFLPLSPQVAPLSMSAVLL